MRCNPWSYSSMTLLDAPEGIPGSSHTYELDWTPEVHRDLPSRSLLAAFLEAFSPAPNVT